VQARRTAPKTPVWFPTGSLGNSGWGSEDKGDSPSHISPAILSNIGSEMNALRCVIRMRYHPYPGISRVIPHPYSYLMCHLSIHHPSTHSLTNPSIHPLPTLHHLPIHLSSIHLPIIHLSIYPPIHPSTHPFIHLLIYPSTHQSIHPPTHSAIYSSTH
jgi:hypothetical protein